MVVSEDFVDVQQNVFHEGDWRIRWDELGVGRVLGVGWWTEEEEGW